MSSQARIPLLVAVALLAVLAAPVARAQYFGRNAVQWERLKFEVLKTPHFDIYFYEEEREAAEQAGRLAERWYARLSELLAFQMQERQPLILYASHPHFQQTNTIGGQPGEGTGGVTEAYKRRIVMPLGGSLAETDHVLGHELVHAFQYATTGQGRISETNFPAALRMPLWFIEGMAEYLSVGPVDPHTAMWLRDAARRDKLPTIRQLASARYFPYRYGQALWAYIAGRFGDRAIAETLRAIGPRTTDAEAVLEAVLGVKTEQLSKDWHAAIRESYAQSVAGTQPPASYGPALITKKGQGGRLNVGPALSPDGQRLAFLSERELFSVELFVADTRSGEVERRLSESVTDPHIESLQFIQSAGAWDPSGQRFALGAVARGRPLLLILRTDGGREREVPFRELGEIFTPSWSPDGRRVVFSAMVGGFTDLYVYDLETGRLERLTRDPYADLQPAWSPDGRGIAFVTDRYSTRLETLDPGNYRLALYDLETREVRALPGFPYAKNIDPKWSQQGDSLYFISDRSGTPNVYRLELAGGGLYQLTNLPTGVSGITPLSPALSSAARADRLAYSAYQDELYEIYAIEGAERLAGTAVSDEARSAAGVIPGARPEGAVVEAREDATTGLASPRGFTREPYKSRLSLDYIGQPAIVGGTNRYGGFVGGGASALWSDMLGNHQLVTVLQAERVAGFNDVGGLVMYVNRARRLNWGLQLQQVPYVSGLFGIGTTDFDGQPAIVEQTLLERQIDRRVAALAFYPFGPALRVEGYAGYRRISFDSRLTEDFFSRQTGQFLGSRERDLASPSTLSLSEGSLALVGDTSVFGATSPVLGRRFRLEVLPTFGTVSFTGALADVRQYVMPFRPLTLAARVLHFGRYGSGGEDPRLLPLFVGYPSLVRGYDVDSFDASECGPQPRGGCPVYDQLLGSRLLVGNLEARIPLFALFGARNFYGPLPIEVGAFYDTGVAWDSRTKPEIFGGERELVRSWGLVGRLNLLGFAVLQLDWSHPLDRPGKDAFFQFNFLAGF